MTSDTKPDTFEHGIGVLAHGNKQTDNILVEDPISVNGVLIPEDTVLEGGQGVRYFFTGDDLEAAERIINDQLDNDTIHIVKNFHELDGQAPADDIIGQLTGVRHSPGVGLLFDGEISDEETAEKIANGFLSVSPTVLRSLGEFDPDRDARRVADVAGLRDAAIVGRGQPGADIELGSNPSVGTLARDALSRAFDFDTLSVSQPNPDGFTSTAWPPGGTDSVTLDGTFDGEMGAARRSATFIRGDGEDFGDLSLFVLNADGEANTNALDSAWTLASQTEGVTESDVTELRAFYESLAERAREAGELSANEFDETWSDRIDDTDTQPPPGDDGSADDGTQSTDGPADAPTSNNPSTDTMDLSDDQQALLAAVEDPSEAIDVLQDYYSREEPDIYDASNQTTIEPDALKSLKNSVTQAKEAFAALLADDSPLSADALARSDMDALTEPFRDEDGDIDVDTLRQTPSVGDPDGDDDSDGGADDGPIDLDTLGRSDANEIRQLRRKRDTFRNRNMDGRADALEADIADMLEADSFEDVADEVEAI